MTVEEAMKWADTFGPLQSDPPDGDAPALMVLAAEVRRLRHAVSFGELGAEFAATFRRSLKNWRKCRN